LILWPFDSAVAFALGAVKEAGDEALRNPHVRQGLRELGRGIDEITNGSLSDGITKAELREVIKEELKEQEDEYKDLRSDRCAQCANLEGAELMRHLRAIRRTWQEKGLEDEQARYHSSGDQFSNDNRVRADYEELLRANEKWDQYVRSERAAERNNPRGEPLKLDSHQDLGTRSSVRQGLKAKGRASLAPCPWFSADNAAETRAL
jgi:hypothetical protein